MSVDGPRGPEEQIARLTVAAAAELLPPVADFVRQTARRLGLTGEASTHLQEAVEAVCRNVVENAFGPDDDGRYEVFVLRRPGQVVVAVEDLGLPGDYERFESGEDSALSEMLRRSFADEIHFLNLGRGGNRVELSKDLPHTDVRDHVPEDEHRETAHAPPAADDGHGC